MSRRRPSWQPDWRRYFCERSSGVSGELPLHGPAPEPAKNVSTVAALDRRRRRAGVIGFVATDPRLPPNLSPAGDDLFRLRGARDHRRHPRHVDQGATDALSSRAGRDRRLAEPAVDRENGFRRTGRQRTDLRLAAKGVCAHRRGLDRVRHADPRRRCRRMDHVRPRGSSLHSRRDADRRRHRGAGRRGRCDVDRGRRAPGRWRQRASGGCRARRARHGPGDRPLGAVGRHAGGGWTLRAGLRASSNARRSFCWGCSCRLPRHSASC